MAGADVLLGDPALRAGTGHGRKVDPKLLCDLAHEWRGLSFRGTLWCGCPGRGARPFPDGLSGDDDEHGPDRDDLAFVNQDGHGPCGG